MAHKKYTQPSFDLLVPIANSTNPFWRNINGEIGHMYRLFAEMTRIRRQKGMTQQQLANLAGISQPTLARIEAGRANPTLSQLTRIMMALNCDLTITVL